MRARWILNFFLLILVAGLGWAVLRDVREARESSRLTGMDPTRIEGVELTRPGGDIIKLERMTGGGWRMTAPYRVAAGPERVERLLEVVRAGVARSFPAEGVDLERLGLEPDPVRISLGGQTLRFGGTEPIDRLRYVASGDLVHLTEDYFYHLLTAPAYDYVDPQLLAGQVPVAGDLNGEPLDSVTLAAIAALKAERIEPLGGDLGGQIVQVQPEGEGGALRFVVSPDGLRWSRPDLRLTYLVASPPPAFVDPEAAEGPGSGADASPQATQGRPLPEEAVGVLEVVGSGPGEGQAGLDPGAQPPAEVQEGHDRAASESPPAGGEGRDEPTVDPEVPSEIRVERLAPEGPSTLGEDLDPEEARQRQIDDAVSASFGGPPVRSQAQVEQDESGTADGDTIVTPEEAAGPPPAVKLKPE
jgi:hypothetical protein